MDCVLIRVPGRYGDFSPKSNIGKPFFIVWSIFAVPTMTVLIQEMSATVISAVNNWTITLADFTVLPKKGIFKVALDKNPGLKEWVADFAQRKAGERRVREGFQIQDPDDFVLERMGTVGSGDGRLDDQDDMAPHIEPNKNTQATSTRSRMNSGQIRDEADEDDDDGVGSDHDLAQQLAKSIKGVAQDLRVDPPIRYSFEEWVRFTRLIRFSRGDLGQDLDTIQEEVAEQEEEGGLVEWDWLGENSPMLADITEAEWVLNRLCESLNRYTKKQAILNSRGYRQSLERSKEEVD